MICSKAPSAMIRPLLMMTMSSTVCAVSPMRWLAVDRLVQHEETGLAQQSGRQSEALPHAERVLANPPRGGFGQADLFENLADAPRRDPVGLRDPAQMIDAATLRDGGCAVEHRSDGAERLSQCGVRLAVDECPAGCGAVQTEENAQRC